MEIEESEFHKYLNNWDRVSTCAGIVLRQYLIENEDRYLLLVSDNGTHYRFEFSPIQALKWIVEVGKEQLTEGMLSSVNFPNKYVDFLENDES